MNARPDVELAHLAGQVMPLSITGANKTVLVAITGLDSDAKRAGYDLMYMTCSQTCGEQMRAALQDEIDRGNRLSLG
jgi:curli biogenesis system outer membrane secretion channel CsgG